MEVDGRGVDRRVWGWDRRWVCDVGGVWMGGALYLPLTSSGMASPR